MAEYSQVSAADAIGLVSRDEVWLLDVREPHEWALGHASAAHHIPMNSIGARQTVSSEPVTMPAVSRLIASTGSSLGV